MFKITNAKWGLLTTRLAGDSTSMKSSSCYLLPSFKKACYYQCSADSQDQIPAVVLNLDNTEGIFSLSSFQHAMQVPTMLVAMYQAP